MDPTKISVRIDSEFNQHDHAQLLRLYHQWQGRYGSDDLSISTEIMTLKTFEECLTQQCVDLGV